MRDLGDRLWRIGSRTAALQPVSWVPHLRYAACGMTEMVHAGVAPGEDRLIFSSSRTTRSLIPHPVIPGREANLRTQVIVCRGKVREPWRCNPSPGSRISATLRAG